MFFFQERMSGQYYESGLRPDSSSAADRSYSSYTHSQISPTDRLFSSAAGSHRPISAQSSSEYPQSSPNYSLVSQQQLNQSQSVNKSAARGSSKSAAVSYSDLCFPKTSNYGSMRKQSKKAQIKANNKTDGPSQNTDNSSDSDSGAVHNVRHTDHNTNITQYVAVSV